MSKFILLSFYGQADHKGGEGGSAPSALTVIKCEMLIQFFLK